MTVLKANLLPLHFSKQQPGAGRNKPKKDRRKLWMNLGAIRTPKTYVHRCILKIKAFRQCYQNWSFVWPKI